MLGYELRKVNPFDQIPLSKPAPSPHENSEEALELFLNKCKRIQIEALDKFVSDCERHQITIPKANDLGKCYDDFIMKCYMRSISIPDGLSRFANVQQLRESYELGQINIPFSLLFTKVRLFTQWLKWVEGPIEDIDIGHSVSQSTEIFTSLLKSGRVDVNARESPRSKLIEHACHRKDIEKIMLILDHEEFDPSQTFGTDSIPPLFHRYSLPERPISKHSNRESNFNIVDILWKRYGFSQLRPFVQKYAPLAKKYFGLSEEEFSDILKKKAEEIVAKRDGYLLDRSLLVYFSELYQTFWDTLAASISPTDTENFQAALSEFPLASAKINFLPAQHALYLAMQECSKTQGFPSSELWRFGIDERCHDQGCCAFEDEPGYLKGFFEGMRFAIETRNAPKTLQWYHTLHFKTVEGVETPSKRFSFEILIEDNQPMDTEYRNGKDVQFPIDDYDQDSYGIEDLRSRRPCSQYSYNESNGMVVYARDYSPGWGSPNNQHRLRVEGIFNTFDQLINKERTRAEKLILFLWIARELDLEHVYKDGNGRSGHLSFLSMIAEEEMTLPFCLFPDPNIFDANGPESIAYRYLEGCVNFRKGGIGHSYKKSKSVKKLDTLPLEAQDLIALRNELKPLVENRSWKEVIEAMG